MLIGQNIAVTLIDQDVEMIEVAGSFGAKVYYGDGTRIDLLRQAGAAEAELLAFCLDGDAFDAGQVHAIHKRSEEHTSELQSLMRISYAVFCLKKKKQISRTEKHISCPHLQKVQLANHRTRKYTRTQLDC